MTNDELSDLLEERRYEKAASEFMSIEADFGRICRGMSKRSKGTRPLFSIPLRVLNPSRPRHELVRDTQREILNRAGILQAWPESGRGALQSGYCTWSWRAGEERIRTCREEADY